MFTINWVSSERSSELRELQSGRVCAPEVAHLHDVVRLGDVHGAADDGDEHLGPRARGAHRGVKLVGLGSQTRAARFQRLSIALARTRALTQRSCGPSAYEYTDQKRADASFWYKPTYLNYISIWSRYVGRLFNQWRAIPSILFSISIMILI